MYFEGDIQEKERYGGRRGVNRQEDGTNFKTNGQNEKLSKKKKKNIER